MDCLRTEDSWQWCCRGKEICRYTGFSSIQRLKSNPAQALVVSDRNATGGPPLVFQRVSIMERSLRFMARVRDARTLGIPVGMTANPRARYKAVASRYWPRWTKEKVKAPR